MLYRVVVDDFDGYASYEFRCQHPEYIIHVAKSVLYDGYYTDVAWSIEVFDPITETWSQWDE
jgi:hypothetical protein